MKRMRLKSFILCMPIVFDQSATFSNINYGRGKRVRRKPTFQLFAHMNEQCVAQCSRSLNMFCRASLTIFAQSFIDSSFYSACIQCFFSFRNFIYLFIQCIGDFFPLLRSVFSAIQLLDFITTYIQDLQHVGYNFGIGNLRMKAHSNNMRDVCCRGAIRVCPQTKIKRNAKINIM